MTIDEQLRAVFTQRPCGLLTDIDGTISPLARVPDEARVTPIARDRLRQLAQRLDLVAAISGRPAAIAASMVALPELTYVGNHGLELWHGDRAVIVPEARPHIDSIRAVLREARTRIALRGVLFEDKGVTASVHYRQATDHLAADQLIGAVLEPLAHPYGLRLTRGDLVWEIRPPLPIDKGTATLNLIQQHRLRGAIFLGDDRTDVDAFAVLRRLRERDACTTLSIGVDTPQTLPIVRDEADVLVAGVSGVEQVLAVMLAIVG